MSNCEGCTEQVTCPDSEGMDAESLIERAESFYSMMGKGGEATEEDASTLKDCVAFVAIRLAPLMAAVDEAEEDEVVIEALNKHLDAMTKERDLFKDAVVQVVSNLDNIIEGITGTDSVVTPWLLQTLTGGAAEKARVLVAAMAEANKERAARQVYSKTHPDVTNLIKSLAALFDKQN